MMTLLTRTVAAICCTIVLLLAMSYLINPGALPEEVVEGGERIIITRKERLESSDHVKPTLPSPPEVTPSPPPVMARPRLQNSVTEVNFTILRPNINTSNSLKSTVIGNRRAIPMVVFKPQYPPSAERNDIEGWVLVEFTITVDGSVEDIVVIDAQPPNTFDREVRRTMSRWRYQPKMVDGRPVKQTHMREIFRFQLDKT